MRTVFENVQNIKKELAGGNPFGEAVTLVAAIKTQGVDAINEAIRAGVDAVAENRVQEFREKSEYLLSCPQHFIGHLQTNKVKYLVGKIDLFHSVDRDGLLTEISHASEKIGAVSNILLQVNIGEESSKGGYALREAEEVFLHALSTPAVRVKGFMAMLPESDDLRLLGGLTRQMRALFERAREHSSDVQILSVGMSGDYRLCVENGSNCVRIGSRIFGARNYQK